MIEVYIGSERLDLFKDEDVTINLSIQNIKDISKVFTDYTQNFSVPASKVNNAVFKHYYNADILGGFDSALRKSATLVVDKEPFRAGSIELLSVNLKNGNPESYDLVFFSAGVSLKDLFGEDELTDLDLSAYDHDYTGAVVRTGIEQGLFSADVIYPLISPVGDWFFNSNSSSHEEWNLSYHKTNDDHGLHYYEVKPAMRISKILDAIETKYGISFTSTFFSSSKFTNLYMWAHRREGWMFKDQENGWLPAAFRYQSTSSSPYVIVDDGGDFIVQGSLVPTIDLLYDVSIISGTDVGIYIYVNGNLFITKEHTTSVTGEYVLLNGLRDGDVISIKYGPSQGSAGANFEFSFDVELFSAVGTLLASASTGGVLMTFDNEVKMSQQLPEQKVSDFINGLVKMFNLTIEPLSSTEFRIEPLDDWYALGSTYDITSYTDITNVNIVKPELYKRISFSYELADSKAMKAHRQQNGGIAYGDLRADFIFDGGELSNQTTFELLRYDKLFDINTSSNVDFLIGKSIDDKAAPYIGEPVIFYSNGVLDISANPIGFLDETGLTPSPADPIEQVMFFANVDNSVTEDVSQMLTFGLEIDPYHEQAFNETLYDQFWSDYVTDLYSTQRRLYSFKAILPMDVIGKIKMNDKLVISGRRYIINSIRLNLTTREATLELLNDV
jgi:hypothetical protein